MLTRVYAGIRHGDNITPYVAISAHVNHRDSCDDPLVARVQGGWAALAAVRRQVVENINSPARQLQSVLLIMSPEDLNRHAASGWGFLSHAILVQVTLLLHARRVNPDRMKPPSVYVVWYKMSPKRSRHP